jgi:PKD repeat protein
MRSARLYLVLGLLSLVGIALTGCLGGMSAGPKALFTASAVEEVIPFTASFDASLSYDPDGRIVSYVWDFGDGAGGIGPLVAHAYEENGVYKVELTVIDGQGSQASSSLTVHALNPLPKGSFTYSPRSQMGEEYIVGASEWITFDGSASTDDGEIVAYDWNFGDAKTDTGPLVKHRFLWPGTYSVVLTVTDDDGGKTNCVEKIKVLGGPPCNADIDDGSGGTCQ